LHATPAKGILAVNQFLDIPVQVTKLKMKQKQLEGIAEARSGERGPVSFAASGYVCN